MRTAVDRAFVEVHMLLNLLKKFCGYIIYHRAASEWKTLDGLPFGSY